MQELSSLELRQLSGKIKTDIENWCAREYQDEHRTYLGASVIGHECSRYVWSAFRWLRFEVFNGRMLRLFDRGHKEEARFIEWLRGIGFTVWDRDENGNQFRIIGANGHYGGSSDSVGKAPYPHIFEPMLLEFKTHNAGSFAKLVKEGLKLSKPRHYSQMCSYGVAFKLRYGVYFAISKNDDDIYVEVVYLDPNEAIDMARKAEEIIFATVPPAKISMQATYFECKYCPFQGICHFGEIPEKNCRSCRDATPVEGGNWYCERWRDQIPAAVMAKGCDEWRSIV